MTTLHCANSLTTALALAFTLASSPLSNAAPGWQAKEGREQITGLLTGHVDETIQDLERTLEEYPEHQESLFALAMAYSMKGDVTAALRHFGRARAAGVPLERFLAGPRGPLAPLVRYPTFQAQVEAAGVTLLHGPLLGAVTDTSARFWVRALNEIPVRVQVAREGQSWEEARFTEAAEAWETADYTAVAAIDGLEPGAVYRYRVWTGGQPTSGPTRFKTFPNKGAPAAFTVAFGGGAAYTPQFERMWDTIREAEPTALLMLGDNVYIDQPTLPGVQRYCYYRRQSVPAWRRLTASTPVFAIWDDHDFVRNDAGGGPEVNEPAWKIPVWQVFQQNWNNPGYGDGPEHPGCWFDFSIADVDFFMLDGRYYRTDPKKDAPSMLGPYQKEWLFRRLNESDATFKVIASPVPWSFGAKPGSLDPWQGYPDEREEIFRRIERDRIEGVILIAADRHRSDAWKIERPNGYDLFEFESSRLTNLHTHPVMKGSLFGYNEKCSFGRLEFDTTQADPKVAYTIVNIDGEPVQSLTLKRSQLEF